MGNIKKERIVEFDYMRVWLTLLVVVGHARHFGPFNVNFPKAGLADFAYSIVCVVIYSFHMPAFFALSGACFTILIQKYLSEGFTPFVKSKFYRLIVPLLFTFAAVDFPIKYFSGFFKQYDLLDYFCVTSGKISHLWFLEALFGVFIIIWILTKYVKNVPLQFLIVTAIYVSSEFIPDWSWLKNPIVNSIWFYLGMTFAKFREPANLYMRTHSAWLYACVATFLLMFCIKKFANYDAAVAIPVVILGTIIFYRLSLWCSDLNLFQTHISKWSANSLGVYLYAAPFRYPMFALLLSHYGPTLFDSEIGFCVFIAADITIPIILAYAFTNLLRKFNMKYTY